MDPSINPQGQDPGLLVIPNAAAQTARRELLLTALQRKPLVALAVALLSPILGLVRPLLPRAGSAGGPPAKAPNEISRLRLESYRSTHVLPRASSEPVTNPQRIDNEPVTNLQRIGIAVVPGQSLRSARRRRVLPVRSAVSAGKGGTHHG